LLTRRSTPIRSPAEHLIILGGTPTAIAVARDARRLGVKTSVLDVDGGVIRHSSAVDNYVACEDFDDALAVLERIDNARWLIADSDHWLRFIVENSSLLPHATILHPAAPIVNICLNKVRFGQWCRDSGFRCPSVVDPDNPEIPFPVVVRPNQTRHRESDAPKARVARNRRELEACLHEFQRVQADYVITEALIGPSAHYLSVGFARRGDGEMLAFAIEKTRPPIERCGGASFVQSCDVPQAVELASLVASQMNFVGIGEMEFVSYDGDLSIVELNPRPWLQYGLGRALGLSLLGFAALGQPQPEPSGKATWVNLGTDAYWCLSRSEGLVWRGQLPFRRFVAQVCAADCRLLWDRRDPLPLLLHLVSRR